MFRRQGNLRFIQGRRHGFLVLLLLLLWRQESNEVTLSVRHSVSPPPPPPPQGRLEFRFRFPGQTVQPTFQDMLFTVGKKRRRTVTFTHFFSMDGASLSSAPHLRSKLTPTTRYPSLSLLAPLLCFFFGGGERKEGRSTPFAIFRSS